jgi:hypothetical protein
MLEEKQEGKEKERPRCSNCKSSFTYFRMKGKERVCRQCGFIEKVEKVEKVLTNNKDEEDGGVILNG